MYHNSIESVDLNNSLPIGAKKTTQYQLIKTPRPTPLFFQQAQSFSTKKERLDCTPRDQPPPRPPVKSAPPVSRIFPHRLQNKPQSVSFKYTETSLLSPHYNQQSQKLYFDQCFEMECKLGAGSFGEVFQVRSRENGKRYAVKRSRERFRGESDRKRKLGEVAKHEKLPKHPNCVEFVKAWEEKQHLYIQTELCQKSLNHCAESNHNIPEKLIWNYLVDLLMAVKHLHDHELVHMDIKPENIFITTTGVCKLGDFGLVLDICNGVDYSEAQEGDPKYLSPELMQGMFGKPADVFSLGITILELASDLDLPRGGDLWHQLRSGYLPDEFLLAASPELKRILRWAMQPDDKKRPTVDELLNDPFMKRIWTRRRREQILRYVVESFKCVLTYLMTLLLTLWLVIVFPIKSVLPHQLRTPVKKSNDPQHPPEWDHSFSDDDVFGEDISIHNNSMGVPLDLSSSSNESNHDHNVSARDRDGFVIPSLPARRAMTTPGYRSKGLMNGTPSRISSSPVYSSGSRGTIYSSSPVHSPYMPQTSFRSSSITPNSSFGEKLADLEDEPEKPKKNVEPKNLLDAFESASSDDD